jgi:1-acyl-sn-glycerol-3-phosphate acyltransferase
LLYLFLTRLARLITLVFLGSQFRVHGLEHLPRSGPLLLVSNHVGAPDPPLVGAFTPRTVYFLAKAELFERPVSRWLMRAYHAFPIVRHSPDRAAIKTALDLLARGQVVVLFPEGTRSPDGQLHRAEPGAGFLAVKSNTPIVPLAITGTEHVLPRGARWLHRTPVTMTYGEPFTLPAFPRHDYQAVADYLMTRIAALLPAHGRGYYGEAGRQPA